MGDLSTLKAAVAAAIRTNGNQEITGQVLQNTLTSIINTLGTGAQYMGIATPSTNPGTPDARVFYIASANGTYSNFGGITVNNEVVILVNSSGSWVKQTTGFATIDGLNNVINQIGTLSNLQTQTKTNLVAAINEVVTKLTTLTNNIGNLASLSTEDKTNLVAAINEVLTTFNDKIGELSSLTTEEKTNLVAAINEVVSEIIILNTKTDSLFSIIYGSEEEDEVVFVQQYTDVLWTTGGYPTTPDDTGNNQIMKINVYNQGYTKIRAKLAHSIDSTDMLCAISFSDQDNNVIGYVKYKNSTSEGIFDYYEDIPSGTYYIWVFNRKPLQENVPNLVFEKKISEGIINKLNSVAETVNNIKGVVTGEETATEIEWTTTNGGTLANGGINIDSSIGNNVLMRIPIAKGEYQYLRATLAHAADPTGMFDQISMFADVDDAIHNVVRVPYKEATISNASDYEVKIPESATSIWLFNRANQLENPSITLVKQKKGLVKRVEELESSIKYTTCVQKPLSFSGKSCLFFGDSITYGYMSVGGQSQSNYPKMFAQYVGATATNKGESGSTLTDLTATTPNACIFNKIKETALNSDFLFIAGGVNDWQMGVDEVTLKASVKAICEYLKTNYNGIVTFITPINESGRVPTITPQQTLQNVRNVITRVAIEYEFNVVQGAEFPFPIKDDVDSYKMLMFQDNLHPTDLGYRIYAKSLSNAMC